MEIAMQDSVDDRAGQPGEGPFDRLAEAPRWVAWCNELRDGRATKVPHSPHRGFAKADDPTTWGTRSQAETRARLIVNSRGGGVGIELGDLGDGTHLAGLDLDSCLAPDDALAPWAQSILDTVPSYAEISPSGTGLKLFFLAACADIRPSLDRFGLSPDQWGCRRDVPGHDARDHGPAVELYFAGRFFTVTERHWSSSPEVLTA